MGNKHNSGRIRKGEHRSPATEFKKGCKNWREPKPFWDRAWLFEKYVTQQQSATAIAGPVGCTESNILYWLAKHEIPRRSMSETRSIKHWGVTGEDNPMYGKTGDKNHRWRGGCSPERQACYVSQAWVSAIKDVWARDRAVCRRCGKKGKMHVHHIVSFAVEETRTDPDNLILLCVACHRWVHSKRNLAHEFIEKEGKWGAQ